MMQGYRSIESDEVLLMHIQKDEQEALEVLFEKYYSRLCDFAFQYVRSFDLTEEIVSDVFLKIWQRRKTLDITGSLKAYLFTATRNQSLNYIQKEKLNLECLNDFSGEIASAEQHPEERLIFKEFQNRIETLINTLPPKRKVIFKLSRIEGFAYQEIAEMLSISIHTVQNQMVQAVKQLSSYSLLDK